MNFLWNKCFQWLSLSVWDFEFIEVFVFLFCVALQVYKTTCLLIKKYTLKFSVNLFSPFWKGPILIMCVASSYLSVPFRTSERPATSSHLCHSDWTHANSWKSSAVCLAFPVVVESFEAARCHRPPVVVSFRGNINGEVTGYPWRQSQIQIRGGS
jgi:hypothetical protein